MSRARARGIVTADEATIILRPRDGLVAEEEIGPGRYGQREGPLAHYWRTVSTEARADGRVAVDQTVEFRLGIPLFSWLFSVPVRIALRAIKPAPSMPWWGPPQRLDRRATVALAALAALATAAGYMGGLLALTMTYAAREFGKGRTAQGLALGVVRGSVVLALGLLVLADRRGRRRTVLVTASVASVATALGALAPSLTWLTADQIVAVTCTGTVLVLVGVMAAEEMPAGARAWSVAVLTLSVGLGAGAATIALPAADAGLRAWRWLFAGGGLALPIVMVAAAHLPESRRFSPSRQARRARGSRIASDRNRRRLVLLGCGVFLYGLFVTPSGQFQNEFLRTERHFSALRISAFTLTVGTVPALAVLLGGRMADSRGRRVIAAAGIGFGAVTTVASYLSHGWALWAWALADSALFYLAVPAMGVYGPELFPTSVRSQSTGLVGIAFAAGGVTGLVITGVLAQAIGTIGPALAVLAIGPAGLVVLIVTRYPETARRELEELNPGDAGPGPAG